MLTVPFDDWDVLYRERLQLAAPDRLGGTDSRATATAGAKAGEATGGTGRVARLAALGLAGLVAADIALLAGDRLRRRRR